MISADLFKNDQFVINLHFKITVGFKQVLFDLKLIINRSTLSSLFYFDYNFL